MKIVALLLAALALQGAPAAAAADRCARQSAAQPPRVVELYTSEGCSSCPPADRWLSSISGRPDVLALAFHVDYWDRLGWADRFASPATTARQYELARLRGSTQVYTPQVVVDGQDWRGWPALPAAQPIGGIALSLAWDGDIVTARIGSAPRPLAGYWAVVEDDHASRIAAGENAGRTLEHDAVVRLYRPVEPWSANAPHRLTLRVVSGVAAHPRRVVFVVIDAATRRPLQALALAC